MSTDGYTSFTLKETPETDRPRERLKALGPSYLSDAELLAIILRVGIKGENVIDLARRLLAQNQGITGLASIDFNSLASQRGVGEAKACQIKAALELGRRYLKEMPEQRRRITSPEDIADLLMLEMGHLEQEHLRVVQLNTKNQILAITEVYKGGLNSALIRPADVFKPAVRNNAASIILAHNHPSGDPTPSSEDVRTTESLIEAGKLLDIEVLDHIIVGRNSYTSMRRRHLGFR
ncbi:DNA repair protein RadC [Thermobaculum terrenum ATCC BAA-798]|uniref:DNA repair protein RadC n=1 Tax=Thermobaculum terrenum (strain ATCC BAA-798 / CCMEE 7001 / YNP1) TaxID=525904 RepID=D1CCM1_THET1|nr:DNA repair protein RadC [Thermobaculum terrenum]ACZ42536.1 DNA repair protein RadC [Thermobaculum terrenum ATCC BAA-798]